MVTVTASGRDRHPGGRTLVAGVGNVFLGDDGFGVAVAGQLRPVTLPDGVDVADYGIRGVHLAYDLLGGGYQRLILLDAVQLHAAPGTLAVLDVSGWQPEAEPAEWDRWAGPAVDAHAMDPATVLHTLRGLDARVDRVLVVGCQPARVAEGMELSPPVRAAVGAAVRLVVDLVADPVTDLLDDHHPVERPDRGVRHAVARSAGRAG